ncbi:gamma-glutamyl-gamma-aminobutyrate hydrolase family protein [Lacrimispora indolis]|uniref:gamma-glutamyl-gamma-aminobutyrate hydrolase family protein n=1 Tax=Lacrimispora indolis TaxID=69825 RepID=UPI00045EA4E7|nr:gamma-glutamyl-gamma-aminobutyrate hydrolase family protein [Lacrimispora indolis]
MKPVILICGGPAYDRQFLEPAVMVNKTYTTAVAAAGGVPLLPIELELTEDYCDKADGLILTGSVSFSPKPELSEAVQKEEPKRSIFDASIYQAFVKAKKPVLGICLGHQVINEQQGGTIIRNFKYTEGIEHMLIQHSVKTEKGSLLHELFGEEFYVNSRHNNKIGILGKSLKAAAYSNDRVIEAIEHDTLPVYGVEWHPERMRGDIIDPPEGIDMSPMFEAFVKICGSRKLQMKAGGEERGSYG